MKAGKKKQQPGNIPTKKPSAQTDKLFLPAVIFLMAVAFLLYSNTLGHGYVLDDYAAITGNPIVKEGMKSIPELFTTAYWFGITGNNNSVYRPLSLMMFATEWQLSPDNPFVSHFINVLLYTITTGVLFLFLKIIFNKINIAIPFLVTLLWVAHPVHTEVVANIKGRDEILAFLFSILCLLYSYKYALSKEKLNLIFSLLAFFLALLSKETAICVLILVPATIWFFSKDGIKNLSTLWISLAVVTAVYFLIRFSVLQVQLADSNTTVNDNSLLGIHNFPDRMATAFYLMGMYFMQMIFPATLSSDYSFNQIPTVTITSPFAWLSLIATLALAGYCAFKFKRRDIIAYGILIFFASIALVSNMVMLIGSTFADRFLYFPSIGFIIAFVFLLIKILKIPVNESTEEFPFFKTAKYSALSIIVGGACILMSFKTFARNKDWKDALTLYGADIANAPNSSKLKFFYASNILKSLKSNTPLPNDKAKLLAKAMEQLELGISIDPNYDLLYFTLADALKYQKNYSAAADAYKKTISINPRNYMAYVNLGNIYYSLQQNDSALFYYMKALKMNPKEVNTLNGLGACYYSKGEYEDAAKYFSKATAINPNDADAFKNLGSALEAQMKYDEAINAYNRSLILHPDNAEVFYYLSTSYHSKGDAAQASVYSQKAHALDPKY